jgi:hypothetical protein
MEKISSDLQTIHRPITWEVKKKEVKASSFCCGFRHPIFFVTDPMLLNSSMVHERWQKRG